MGRFDNVFFCFFYLYKAFEDACVAHLSLTAMTKKIIDALA